MGPIPTSLAKTLIAKTFVQHNTQLSHVPNKFPKTLPMLFYNHLSDSGHTSDTKSCLSSTRNHQDQIHTWESVEKRPIFQGSCLLCLSTDLDVPSCSLSREGPQVCEQEQEVRPNYTLFDLAI